jgi:hypothetical protein
MRQAIDGVRYDTEASTRIAEKGNCTPLYNHKVLDCEAILYQTRYGACFLHQTFGRDWEGNRKGVERLVALSTDDAEKWATDGSAKLYRDLASVFDEENEIGGTIYIRAPAALKREVEAAAAKPTVNAYALRCLEACLCAPGGLL